MEKRNSDLLCTGRSNGKRLYMEGEKSDAKLQGACPGNPAEPCAMLTLREREVLELLARGLPYKQIADKMDISTCTVNNHLANIRCKLGARSGIEAINKAFPRP